MPPAALLRRPEAILSEVSLSQEGEDGVRVVLGEGLLLARREVLDLDGAGLHLRLSVDGEEGD